MTEVTEETKEVAPVTLTINGLWYNTRMTALMRGLDVFERNKVLVHCRENGNPRIVGTVLEFTGELSDAGQREFLDYAVKHDRLEEDPNLRPLLMWVDRKDIPPVLGRKDVFIITNGKRWTPFTDALKQLGMQGVVETLRENGDAPAVTSVSWLPESDRENTEQAGV